MTLPARVALRVAVVAALVAAAVGATPAVVAGDAGTTARQAAPSAAACPHRELAFDNPRYFVRRGDEVRFTVVLRDSNRGESASLSVGGTDAAYHASVTLVDGDGDANVTVVFDTAAAGSGRPNETFRAAADADRVAVGSETSLDGPLPRDTYDLTVRDGACARADASLVVGASGPVAVGAYRGSGGLYDELTSPAAVGEALARGELATHPGYGFLPDDAVGVFPGDVLVLALHAPLRSNYSAVSGENDTARFRDLLGEGVTVRLVESPDVVDTHEEPERYRLPDFGRWRVVADPTTDAYYAVVDTAAPVAGDFPKKDYGEEYAAYVVEASVAGVGNDTTAVGFLAPDAAVSTPPTRDVAVVAADRSATVAGTTNLPDGASVTVRLEGPAPLPATAAARVDGGRFSATFDLRGLDPGAPLTVVVRHGGETLASVPGRVGPAATVRFEDRRAYVQHAESVTVDHVALTHGGFVVVRRGSADGPPVGRSRYLPPGNHTDVRVPLDASLDGDVTLVAVAYRDAAGDEAYQPGVEAAYAGGTPADSARLSDLDGTPTATPTPSPAPKRTTRTEGGHDDVPGFGAVAAVLALAAAVLATRVGRRDRGGDDA